jgi:DNA-binding transcriptional regulator YiaG
MVHKYKCSDCKDGYRTLIKGDYVIPLSKSNYTIHNAEYFECEACHSRSLSAKLIKKINEIEEKEAKKIINSILKEGSAHTKSISFLQKVTGIRDIDLSKSLKIPKSTISNWEKRNTELPYHLSIILAGIFAHKLKLNDLESIVQNNIHTMLLISA